MTCDHPPSSRDYETRIYPAEQKRPTERVVRCQRCGAVLYADGAPITEGEDKS